MIKRDRRSAPARARRLPAARPRAPRATWHLVLLAVIGAALIAGGVLELGTPTSSARTARETVTAERGVVQSTVSGTGNVEPATDVVANFKASGTLEQVYVKQGQHVSQGQLLATLDPSAAQLTVNQAELNLTAAEDQLTSLEDGTSSSSSGSGGSGATSASTAVSSGSAEFVSDTTTTPAAAASTTTSSTTPAPTTTTTTTTTAPTRTTTTTTPSRTGAGSSGSGSSSGSGTGSGSASGSSSSGNSGSSGATTTTSAPSPSSIASAEASIDSARATLQNAEQALDETRLYAPAGGTIASLQSVSPGDAISAGSSGSSSSASSAGSSGSSSSGSGSSSAGSLGGSGSSSTGSSSTSSTSSGFAEIIDAGHLTMTVAFSESDISKVKVGQSATVSLDALSGVELAGHVSAISPLGTTSSSVVSYDATITLDQNDARVKPGMSASASVITGQASGVTLPNSAVTGTGSVTTVQQLKNGKTVATPVVVGLKGDSRTQIVSGLPAGAQVVVTTTLPSLGTSSASSATGSSGTLGTRLGGGGFAGGGFAGGGARFGGGGFGGAPGGGG